MRAAAILVAGTIGVFAAHVWLPFLFVSASRSGVLPQWLDALPEAMDPGLWLILLPAVLAVAAYNLVFRHSGVAGMANRRWIRWPMAFVAAFLSMWVLMFVIFNSFGS